MHPDYPYLYIGQTTNLQKRIETHDSSPNDNIDRKFQDALKESFVLFFEVDNKTQADYVEKYLIDKYNPTLNIKDKNDNSCSFALNNLPKWKRWTRPRECADFLRELREYEKNHYTKKKNDLEYQITRLDYQKFQLTKQVEYLYSKRRELAKDINEFVVT
jgi:excinuclease UvrABC nuclease subunit